MKGNILFESNRIVFIKPSLELIDEYKLMYNDESIQSLLFKKKYSEEQILKWINSFINDDSLISMIEKETNKFIGNAALIKKDNNIGEITISITPTMQGKHFATEAIGSLIKYGYEELKFKSLDLYVYKDNKKAIHLYQNMNFKSIDSDIIDDSSIHMVHQK
jgi:RimJ/RimL family protein N-acetyltransferase